jgi:DNA-directed RNA polymerase sigma subunit (sigma70/sigma32)
MGSNDELAVLRDLPPLERLRRTSDLMTETQVRLWELAEIRAKTMRELHRTMSRIEIAQALGVPPRSVHKILKSKQRPIARET